MGANIKHNSIFNFIKTFSQFIFPLITFPYISRVLGAESIGKYNFSNSVVSYVSMIATLGISSYAVRECSKVKQNRTEYEKTASEIFSINIITTVIAYIILFLLLSFSESLHSYNKLIIILSTTIIFNTFGAEWINNVHEDFKFITIRSISFQILAFVLMLLFVRNQSDYINYAWISLLSTSGANLINVFYRRKYGKIRFTFNINLKVHFKPIVYLFAIYISQQIYVNSDITILGLYKGDTAVGIYSTSVKIYNIVNAMICSICMVVIPQISYLFEKKEYNSISKLFNYALNFIVVLGLPAITGINMLCPEIISCLAGNEYLAATSSLRILTIALIFSLLGGLIGNVTIIPAGREKICFFQGIVAATINILFNVVLIPSFGINAAASTTAIAEGVSFVILAINFDKRIRIKSIKKILFGPLLGSMLIICVILFTRYLIHNSILVILVSVTMSMIIYLIVQILVKNEFVYEFLKIERNKIG